MEIIHYSEEVLEKDKVPKAAWRLRAARSKKMRVARLGGEPNNGSTSPTRFFKIRKLRLIRVVSPIKLLAKLHGAYVDMMVRIAGNVGGARRVAGGSNKVAKAEDQIVSVAASILIPVNKPLTLDWFWRFIRGCQLLAN